MEFLLDEDSTPCLKLYLEDWGYEADSVRLRPDLRGEQEDAMVLATAVREGRVVVTHNTDDYEALHDEYRAGGHSHPGIVICSQEPLENFRSVLRRAQNMLAAIPASQFPNQVHYLHTFA